MRSLSLLLFFFILLSGCGGMTTTFINVSAQIGRDICQSEAPNRFVCPAEEAAEEAIACVAIGKVTRNHKGYIFVGSFKGLCVEGRNAFYKYRKQRKEAVEALLK